jgi:hypothetical protein
MMGYYAARDPLFRGYTFLALYVLAPEKLAAFAAFGGGGSRSNGLVFLLWVGGILLDLCGVAALVAGLASPAGLAPALAVGYGAAALGGLCFTGVFIRMLVLEFCAGRMRWAALGGLCLIVLLVHEGCCAK